MEQKSSQLILETSSLSRHPSSPEQQYGVLGVPIGTDDHQRIPDIDCTFDEVALWEEFDIQKCFAEYHLGKYFEYWDRCRDANGGPAVLSDCKDLTRQDEGLSNQNGNKDRWRLKIQHDKIIRDLLKIQGILNMLVADEERITGSRCLKKALACSVVMPSVYFVSHTRFSTTSTIIAAAAAVFAGYGIVSSLSRGGYVGLRVLVIDKCRQIVRSLENRVRVGAVERNDQEIFKGIWFIALDWFNMEK